MHKNFIGKFFRFFRVRKPNKVFYTWNDEEYKEFMISILFALEPRFYVKDQLLYDELEAVDELMFLHNGKVGIGFRINQEVKFCNFQTDYCVVGTYGMIYHKRTEFVYQTFTAAHGQAIRKEKWFKCFEGKEELKRMFEQSAEGFYIKKI